MAKRRLGRADHANWVVLLSAADQGRHDSPRAEVDQAVERAAPE